MSDIVEWLRKMGADTRRLTTNGYRYDEAADEIEMLWNAVAEKNAEIERLRGVAERFIDRCEAYQQTVDSAEDEIERLRTVLNSDSANRYWEGRWRDEKAENERLRAAAGLKA